LAEILQPLTAAQRQQLGIELDRLLGDQLGRVRRRFLVHGSGAVLLVPAALILFAFLLDHFLRLPAPVRVFHTLAILALLAAAAVRFLHYPLTRRFLPVDVALLLERSFPDLHERLVSAIQLKQPLAGAAVDAAALRNQSAAMIEQLLADAAAMARRLPLRALFDPTRTARLWAGAVTLWLLLLGGAATAPDTAWAFVLRHLGRNVPYPRATHLFVELPPAGPDLQRTDTEGAADLVVPAGADLHVSVLARGVVPDAVFLEQETAAGERRSVPMTPRPGGRFRTVFRRITGSFAFHARGGDDDHGDLSVTVRTIHPPLVASIKAGLRPPAYTGRPPTVQAGGAIEALTGTEVSLSVVSTAPVTAATAVFLESGRRVPLATTTIVDDSGSITAQVGTFVVAESDRYQVELVGEGGLRNPNPGTYPVTALQDYAPVGRWLLPEDESGTLLLPEALLCMRAEARDDFGLTGAALTIDAGAGRTQTRALLPPPAPDGARPQQAAFVEVFEVKDLLGDQRGEGIALQLALTDNRLPEANVTQLPRRLAQIVDQAQLAAAIARHFRGLREEVEQSLELQRDRAERLQELVEKTPAPGLATSQVLTAIEVGQGRIQSAADRVHRGAMRAFDLHLWNRLEPSPPAATVVELYRAWYQTHPEPVAHQGAFYRDLERRRREGTLGAMENALDPILAMVVLADGLQGEACPAVLRLLAEAQVAKGTADLEKKLASTVVAQSRIVATLQDLLGRLDAWNTYQDLVQEARALREKQRDVQQRTEEIRGKR
jgi:hypothetical protein